jgi:hypothetical protein
MDLALFLEQLEIGSEQFGDALTARLGMKCTANGVRRAT